jgi:hypothetical protein
VFGKWLSGRPKRTLHLAESRYLSPYTNVLRADGSYPSNVNPAARCRRQSRCFQEIRHKSFTSAWQPVVMSKAEPSYFDPSTLSVLREVLNDAWACLSSKQREQTARSLIAKRILKAASAGQRDRECLIEAALAGTVCRRPWQEKDNPLSAGCQNGPP